jgi:predicted enzyme related to lactoylglutathione lyase
VSQDGALRLELFVDDIERSATFYERALGFTREPGGDDYVSVRRAGAILGIGLARRLPANHHFGQDALARQRGVGVEIVLEVDDLDAAYTAAVNANARVLSPIALRPWGLRDFRVADPDGYYIRVTTR